MIIKPNLNIEGLIFYSRMISTHNSVHVSIIIIDTHFIIEFHIAISDNVQWYSINSSISNTQCDTT